MLWTAERESLLRDVLKALGELDRRMVVMFRGDPDKLAAQLDAVASGRFMLTDGNNDT